MLAQHGMYTYCIVSRVEGFWPDGQENDGAGTAFPRPPSVRPEREREESGSRICMHGSGHNRRRKGKKGRKNPPFPSGLFCPLFTQRKEEGKGGGEGGGKGDPEKRGSDIRDEKVGDSPIT